MKVLQFPLVRITVFFVSGIAFAHYVKTNLDWLIAILLLLFLLQICLFWKKMTILFGITITLLSFFVGVFTLEASVQTRHKNHYINQLQSEKEALQLHIKITEKLKTTTRFNRYVANVEQFNERKSYGKLLININKTKTSPRIEIGSLLKLNGTLYKNKKPNNPNQFDYGNYLENQQIYGQCYTEYHNMKIGTIPDKSITYYASRLRNKIIANLEKNHFNAAELNVIVALILGQQQDISKDIVRDYQYAGAIHILSVSGLHVGLVLLFVSFLLKPISNTRRNAFIKLLVVLAALWGFGILAGLAPSVVRSVTMFSFVAVGMFLRRSVNIYHTLVISALLILLFQPSFLFNVGFQLSYIALFFIIWLQPFLASAWSPKNTIVGYFWDIITVSFAAQLGTLPLSIYYFHQFPGLFFITNLAVLPLLSVIMGLGVLIMVLAAFDLVWLPLLKLTEWSVWILNKIIAWVASFEDFIFTDIPLNAPMMLGLYLLIFSAIVCTMQPTYKKLYLTFSAILLVQFIYFYSHISAESKNEFIVFHQKKHTLLTERHHNKVTVYTSNSKKIQPLNSYLTANFCTVNQTESLHQLYYFKGKRIFLMNRSAVYKGISTPDVLLLTNSPQLNLQRLLRYWKPGEVVVDGSNYKSYVQLWKATCLKEKIPFHDTSEKGFYRL